MTPQDVVQSGELMIPPSAQRIVICFHDFPMGGTERIAIGLAEAWVDAGRDVIMLCGTEEGPQRASVDSRVEVVQLDPPIKRSPFSRLKLGREMGKKLASLAPDLVFLPGNFHLFLANNLRKADPRPAIVLKISNPPVPSSLGAPIAHAVFRHFARGVDALAPMNTGLMVALRQMLPDKSVTTRHDPNFVNVAERPIRPERAKDAPLRILWAGRLEPQKDVPLALATLKALLEYMPAHLTLLGDGAQRATTTKQIATLGLKPHVSRAGHVPSIEPFLADADVLLVTSLYEGGPAVAVEALAHGVPVVSTDCSSLLRDLINHPQAGAIVRTRYPDDLARALRATAKRGRPDPATLGALVSHLEPRACADAYLEWFDEIVRRRAISGDKPAGRARRRFDSVVSGDNLSRALLQPEHEWQG
ncbi:MAG: glycosyltransferase [Candidatus Eremiobacteraeota bacterium]|nr:glycosyltransferase [Candidatus Eremiobacteraeota bacterium]